MYDLAIIGAGPAGATLARLLGKEYRILLLDRRELLEPKEDSFEKCCGGLIAPDAQQMLAKLGLGVPLEVLVGPQLFTVRTIDIQQKLERYYQRNYINIDREKFDSWLVSLVPDNVDIRCGALLKKFSRDDKGVKVHFQHHGQDYTEEARYLVGADGASSSVRRKMVPEFQQRSYIAVQEWFKVESSQPYYSAIFDSVISDFYSWTIPKGDYLIVGATIRPRDKVQEKFELLKNKLRQRGFELPSAVKRNGAFIIRPQSLKQIYIGEGNIILIGEAAGWISPTSAEGLSYALRSAVALAQSIKAHPTDLIREYHQNTWGLSMNICGKNLKAPFMYNPFLRKMALTSGLLSMDIEDLT